MQMICMAVAVPKIQGVEIQTLQNVPFFLVHSLHNFLSWYLNRSELAHIVSEIKEGRGPKDATMHPCSPA